MARKWYKLSLCLRGCTYHQARLISYLKFGGTDNDLLQLVYGTHSNLYLRDTIVVLDMLSVRAKKRSILKEFQSEFLQLFVEYCVLLGSISILAYLRLNSRDFIPSAGLSKESVELLLDVSEPLKLNTVKTKPRQVEKYCPMQCKRMHAIECRLLQHPE